MADQTADHMQDPSQGVQAEALPGALAIATNWLGAIVSISLVGGLGVWGYQLAVRDVREIPVVRALDGAMRVQPDDPGGQTAAHQGLAVNAVQSEGTVESSAAEVVLAPAAVSLTAEDMAQAQQQPVESNLSTETQGLTDTSAEIATKDPTVPQPEVALISTDVTRQETKSAARLAGLPGVKRSPRPRARMAALSALVETTRADVGVADSMLVAVDADPSTIVTGTRLVQLGAFDDRAGAEQEWTHILEKHGDLIGGRQRLIILAESGGRNFYRLRVVGFAELSDSRRLCSALVARGTPCIPVTAR